MTVLDRYDRTNPPSSYIEGYPEMLADAELVLVTPEDFERLDEYSTSQPTGVSIGKVWKAERRGGWAMGMFAECEPPEPDPSIVAVIYRPLEVVS